MTAPVEVLRAEAERSRLRVSWSRPDGWHATLKFLGDVDDAQAARVRERLRDLAPTLAPFPATVVGFVALPARAAVPGVLAVALGDDGRFSALAGTVDERLAPLGFERERRAFVPHVTVGRIHGPRGWRRFAPAFERVSAQSFDQRCEATMSPITLYRSRLGDGPARYEAIESFLLGASRP